MSTLSKPHHNPLAFSPYLFLSKASETTKEKLSFRFILFLCFWSLSIHSFAAPNPPDGFAVEDVLVDVDQPISMRFLPDDRLLLVQKKGQIQIGEVLGETVAFEEYADFNDAAHPTGLDSGNERGLLDITFDPDFPAQPYIYALYTPEDSPDGPRLTVSRFTHVENTGGLTSRLDLSGISEVILWQDTEGYDSCCHFGGGIDFGPDGNLWFTTGDHFQGSYAASLTHAGGGVHRIQKNGNIPLDNPYNDGVGPNVDSLVAIGLRNPFRSRWDLESNTFYISEVGGNIQEEAWEDLHVIRYDDASGRLIDDDFGEPADNNTFDGINFGWPTVEGLPPFTDFPAAQISDVGIPLFAWEHDGETSAINGGIIYRGDVFPEEYQGAYFFADSTRDFLRYIKLNPDGSLLPNPTPDPVSLLNPDTLSHSFDLSPEGRIVSIEEGPDGALYYVSFTDAGGAFGEDNPTVLGALRRYIFGGGNTRPVIQSFTATPQSGVNAPLNTSFDFTLTDAESPELSWQLDFGDGSTIQSGTLAIGTPLSVSHTFQTKGEYSVRLTVSDESLSATETLIVTVGEAPTFTSTNSSNDNPATPVGMFRFGDTYTFTAAAEDSDGNPLPDSAFTWSSEFVRPGNIHPVEGPIGDISSYIFEIPNQGQGFSGAVFYRIFATATDSFGLNTTQTFEIYPQKTEIFFDTIPSGIVVQVDGNTSAVTPFTLDTLVNFEHTITAPQEVDIGEDAYRFNGWSNDITVNQQVFVTPVATTNLTADYLYIGQSGLEPNLVTDGLVLQLESNLNVSLGNAQDVAAWLDQSGLGNDFDSQGDPQFLTGATPSGLPAITFDGVDDLLERINASDPLGGIPQGDEDRTLFVVAKYADPAVFGPGVTYGSTGSNEAFGITRATADGSLVITANDNDINTGAQGLTDWTVQSVTTGTEEVAYLDGLEVSSADRQYNTQLEKFVIGQGLQPVTGGTAPYAEMEVAAILLFDKELVASERRQVEGYLQQKYLGINTPPEVTINSPRDNSIFLPGQQVSLQSSASDLQDGVLADSCSWSSDIDGPLGNGCSLSLSDLSVGTHLITVQVADNSVPSAQAQDQITITIGSTTPVQDGLVLQLESDYNVETPIGSSVTNWLDLSPSRNDLKATGSPQMVDNASPTGLPVISFDGLDDALERISTTDPIANLPDGNGERTVFFVSNFVGPVDAFAGFSYGSPVLNGTFGIVAEPDDGNFVLQGFGGQSDSITSSPAIGTGWSILTAQVADNSGTLSRDGVIISDFAHQYNTVVEQIVLGREIENSGFAGVEVAAVLIYDRALTSLESMNVEVYLRNKYLDSSVNGAPVVTINAPTEESVTEGTPVDFAASAFDIEDGELGDFVSWSSNISGPLGTGDLTNILLPDGVHTISAEVTDSDSQTSVSSFKLTVEPDLNSLPASVTPPVSNGLVLHLESTDGAYATDSNIEQWFDLSGQGNILFPEGSPTLTPGASPTGLPALVLDGTIDSLERNSANSPISGFPDNDDERTLFVVSNFVEPITSFGGVAFGSNITNGTFGIVAEPENGNFVLQGFGPGNDFTTSTSALQQGWSIQTATAGGGTTSLRIDGAIATQATHVFATTSDRIVVGAEIGGNGHAGMEISAILLYDRILDETDRLAVEDYLREKYIFSTVGEMPTVTLSSPEDESSFNEGELVNLTASASDLEDGDLTQSLVWTSDIDGNLGVGSPLDVELSAGSHTLTASVIDSDGRAAQASATVTIEIDLQGAIPPTTAGLVLHLESTNGLQASNNSVVGWLDLSGNGNDLSIEGNPLQQENLTPQGKPGIIFDGQDDAHSRSSSNRIITGLPLGNDDRTVFVVSKYVEPLQDFAGFFIRLRHQQQCLRNYYATQQRKLCSSGIRAEP